MGVSSGLRRAARSAGDTVQAAMKRAGNLYQNVRRIPSRMSPSVDNAMTTSLRANDPDINAKSFDDAAELERRALEDVTSHPLSKGPGETPKTSVKGETPPGKDPTTEMPNTPSRAQQRWEQVRPWLPAGTTILAGVGVGIWLTVCGVRLQNTDGVEVKITKIEKVKDKEKEYKFTYQTQGGQKCGSPPIACIQDAFSPCKNDTFTFRNTYTNPTLNDVTALVIDVDDDAVYFELDITDIGTGTPEWGFMTCHTSFKNQFRSSIREAVQTAVDIVTDVGTPVVTTFCDIVPVPFVCPNALKLGNWVIWLIIACCLLFCLLITFLLIS